MANLEKQYKDNKGPSLTQQDIQELKPSNEFKSPEDLEEKIDKLSQKLTNEITDIKIALSGFMENLIKIEQTILENSEKLLFELTLTKATNKMMNFNPKKSKNF
jgi:hypothetical protein